MLVCRQPALVNIDGAVNRQGPHAGWLRLVGDINHSELTDASIEAEFTPLVILIRAVVDDTLGIVDVAILAVTAHPSWLIEILDIDHVQATATSLAAHGIGKATCLIDGNVVGICKAAVVGRFLECHRVGIDRTQPVKVIDLHAVVTIIVGYHKNMITVDLEVAPGTGNPGSG